MGCPNNACIAPQCVPYFGGVTYPYIHRLRLQYLPRMVFMFVGFGSLLQGCERALPATKVRSTECRYSALALFLG